MKLRIEAASRSGSSVARRWLAVSNSNNSACDKAAATSLPHSANVRQSQIVCTDQADCSQFHECTNNSFGSHAAIMRIGSLQQFIQQEQQCGLVMCQFINLAQPENLGVKAGVALMQRVVHANACSCLKWTKLQPARPHRSPRLRRHGLARPGAQRLGLRRMGGKRVRSPILDLADCCDVRLSSWSGSCPFPPMGGRGGAAFAAFLGEILITSGTLAGGSELDLSDGF